MSCVWKGRLSICPKNKAKEGLILQLFYGRIAWRHCHMLRKYKTVLQIWEQNKPLVHEIKVSNWEEKGCQQKWQCDMRWGPSVRWHVLKSNDKIWQDATVSLDSFCNSYKCFFDVAFSSTKSKTCWLIPSDSPGNVFGCEHRQEGGSGWVATVSRRFLNA